MPVLVVKSGTTAIAGATVKGSFSYFSASTTDLGPTSTTGFYSGIDAPTDGYTVYQIGGTTGWTARVATNDADLNSILIGAGATGSTLAERITWATNTNSIFINSGPIRQPVIFVGGSFTTYKGATQNYLIKLDSVASKDTTMEIGTGFNGQVQSVVTQSDGKILAGGSFTTFSGSSQNYLIRLNSNGSKDSSFNIGTGFNNVVNTIAPQSDGKILVGGSFTSFPGGSQNYLIRLNSNGSKDTSLNIGTGFNNTVNSILIQSDGKILVGGTFTTYSGATNNRLIRLNTDGTQDTSFNIGTGFNGIVTSLASQSDGKILVGGSFTLFTGSTQNRLIRLNSDGSKDTSFDIGTGFGNGNPNSIVVQSDGKILVGGSFTLFTGSTQNYLIRLNTNGSKDTTFDIGTGFNVFVRSVALQSDGKVLVGGNFTTFTGSSQNYLIRLNSNGSKDSTFDVGSGFNSFVFSVLVN